MGIFSNDGDTGTSRAAPAAGGGIMLDRAASGRLWVYNNDDFKIYYSDDEGQNYTVSSPLAIDIATAWSLAVHPTDSNRIALSYQNATSNDMVLEVTTNGGASWAARTIGTYQRAYTVWLPNNRLVSFVQTSALDIVSRVYSDDDGVTWSAASQLYDHGAGTGSVRIEDVRVTAAGYLFGILNQSTGATSLRNLRSADGDTFDVMATHVAARSHALAFDEADDALYISYQTDRIFKVPGAETIASGSWVTGATELTGVPSGSVPVSASLKSNMVVLP